MLVNFITAEPQWELPLPIFWVSSPNFPSILEPTWSFLQYITFLFSLVWVAFHYLSLNSQLIKSGLSTMTDFSHYCCQHCTCHYWHLWSPNVWECYMRQFQISGHIFIFQCLFSDITEKDVACTFNLWFHGYQMRRRWIIPIFKTCLGVSAVVQWVKNPNALAWIAAEVWVGSQCSGLRIWHCCSCSIVTAVQFNPWPRELSYADGVAIKKKKKKKVCSAAAFYFLSTNYTGFPLRVNPPPIMSG